MFNRKVHKVDLTVMKYTFTIIREGEKIEMNGILRLESLEID